MSRRIDTVSIYRHIVSSLVITIFQLMRGITRFWGFHGNSEIPLNILFFSVLAFGIKSAPRIFTKTLRPLVKYWRLHGLKIVVFLDDGWCVNANYERTLHDADFILDMLRKAGFVVNLEKSVFIPTQCLEWLGLVWDLKSGVLRVSDKRIQNTFNLLHELQGSMPFVSARNLAKLAGKIISMSPVLGNV